MYSAVLKFIYVLKLFVCKVNGILTRDRKGDQSDNRRRPVDVAVSFELNTLYFGTDFIYIKKLIYLFSSS